MQLTAVDAIRALVDDWNFNDEQFVEFVGPTMQLLVHMRKDCEELDSQTLVRRGWAQRVYAAVQNLVN
jgi:hypothetical protein